MAGSLSRVIGENGRFKSNSIENLADAHEALEECVAVIHELSNGDIAMVNTICERLHFQKLKSTMVVKQHQDDRGTKPNRVEVFVAIFLAATVFVAALIGMVLYGF